ncbi:MAG TPA: beta-N-acetylhexosaminidase [Thermoanaerobaculia bacterium]|nr:beta-N-acetylhexosaminidase [Thermoanaerobaculia bacterium]
MTGAGELLIVGVAGPRLAPGERRILERVRPGGLILFGRNIEDAGQLTELVSDLRRAAPEALLYLDAEGGRVDRLRGVVGPAPAAAALAAAAPAAAQRSGRWIGRALRRFGFDVDLAPVVDLDYGRPDNSLAGRYLGATPRAVTARARAFLRGLHGAGVGGCVKHFPGLGAAGEDTHFRGSEVALGWPELERDLEPFRALMQIAGAVLISHAIYPAVDPSGRPATLSPAIATQLLRRRLRFRGVAVSDDLEMKALGSWGDLPAVSAAALAAGCDLLPVCHSLEAAPAIARRLGSARLAARRAAAAQRLRRYRRHLARLRSASGVGDLALIQTALGRLARELAAG